MLCAVTLSYPKATTPTIDVHCPWGNSMMVYCRGVMAYALRVSDFLGYRVIVYDYFSPSFCFTIAVTSVLSVVLM